jgi:2-oxoglutarate dehydrogenase E2 component (dihydrolipoamide succinyltransferase)
MAVNIVVPSMGESVTEATVREWLKKEGDAVKVGEPVAVLETDKVDLEVGAESNGVLAQISRPAGSDVKVGDVLGVVDESGAPAAKPAAPAVPATQAASPNPTPGTTSYGEKPVDRGEPSKAPAAVPANATPVAERAAQVHDVDIARVQGSGPGGKVIKNDVLGAAVPAAPTAQTVAPRTVVPSAVITPSNGALAGRKETRERMSRRRQTIARRLVEAQHNAAMLTTFNEIDMSAVQNVRERRKNAFKDKYGVGLGLSSFFVKASIGALKRFPRLNAEIQGEDIITKHYYDIGIAIGAAEGLVVPVLRDADRLSFAAIEQKIKDYAKQTEDGSLKLEDLQGGTFTITNGGIFGSMMSTPILNPPQVGILGLHAIKPRPVVVNNEIVIRPMMYVALSYDHRIVDGREAVQFLVTVKELMEDPESLLIEG